MDVTCYERLLLRSNKNCPTGVQPTARLYKDRVTWMNLWRNSTWVCWGNSWWICENPKIICHNKVIYGRQAKVSSSHEAKRCILSFRKRSINLFLDWWGQCLFQFKFLELHEFSSKVYVYTTSYSDFFEFMFNFRFSILGGVWFSIFWMGFCSILSFYCPLPSPPSVQDDPGFWRV